MEPRVTHARTVPEPTVFSHPSDVENAVTRVFRAPRERVFHFFTDPSTMSALWSPDPTRVRIERYELRAGERFAISVVEKDGSITRFTGELLEVDPPRRIGNTFEVSLLPGVVAIETDEFQVEGAHTRVTVRWTYHSRDERDRMGGPEMERTVTELWDRVALDIESGARAT